MEHNDTLTKLYVEITTRCNLDCAMCVRRAWNEPIGEMPLAVFAELMDQVRDLPEPPIVHLSGYGEPTCHPDFLEMVALAKATDARDVLVSNVVPHTAEMEGDILYRKALQACAFRESRWVPAMSLPKLDLDETTSGPPVGTFGSTASVKLLDASLSARNDFCQFAQRGYAAVRWDGVVSPCLSLLHDHPEYIRGRRKDVTHHSFGNVVEQPLGEIWQGQPFSDFRQRLRAFYFSPCTTCGGCERFPANYVDCIGNTFPTCGGCLWAQGFVQCA